MSTICQQISLTLGDLFTCTSVNGYTRVRTPFLYPDGDSVDIFWRENRPGFLTDLGETLRWLSMQSVADGLTARHSKIIEDVCLTHGIRMEDGAVTYNLRPDESMADAVIKISQAALRISDIWFTMRTRAISSVIDDVAAFLEQESIPFERNRSYSGNSGSSYRVDFHTFADNNDCLVNVLSAGSKPSARVAREHVVTQWHDLTPVNVPKPNPKLISLFDDASDVWTLEDFKLLQSVSIVSMWSRPDDFALLLKAQ